MALTSLRSIVLAAAAVAMTVSTTNAMPSFLTKIPNGESFSQELGHPDKDSSKYTAFAEAFEAADYTWSKELCEDTFPGSSMTNGQAFGDPCCTWKKGATPDFEVTAFTTTPSEATTCASSAVATTAPAPAATTKAPAPAATTKAPAPAATTKAPASAATTKAPAPAATTKAPASATTTKAPAPAATTKAPAATTGGCRAKTPSSSGGKRSSYSFRH